MKNKKRVLIFLLSLIIVLVVVLLVVLILGRSIEAEHTKFKEEIEATTCEYAKKENVTARICEYFSDLCMVKFRTLINYNYLDKEKINPIKKLKVDEDTESYVQITWENGNPRCAYKEGKK